jgi:hypothetical protein
LVRPRWRCWNWSYRGSTFKVTDFLSQPDASREPRGRQATLRVPQSTVAPISWFSICLRGFWTTSGCQELMPDFGRINNASTLIYFLQKNSRQRIRGDSQITPSFSCNSYKQAIWSLHPRPLFCRLFELWNHDQKHHCIIL